MKMFYIIINGWNIFIKTNEAQFFWINQILSKKFKIYFKITIEIFFLYLCIDRKYNFITLFS